MATRVYVTTAVLLIAMFIAANAIATSRVRDSARSEAAFELEQVARLTALIIGDRPFDDQLADSLGAVHDLRVTLIGDDGRVLGDSEIDPVRLRTVENHGDRPEVIAARNGSVGVAERASETIARSLLYVAVPAPGGVVRISTRLEQVSATLAAARRHLLIALASLLVLAFPLSHLATRDIRRRLGQVEETVRALEGGELTARARVRGGDGVGALGSALDALADSLQERMGRSEERTGDLRVLFDRLDDGVAFVDAEGLLQIKNPAFDRWVGREVPVGTRTSGLFRSPRVLAAVDHARSGGSTIEEIPVGERTVLMSARPHRGGALLILRDLTEVRRLEGMRRDFVANVSHELKTPLTSVMGFAEAVAEGELPATTSQDFGTRILANATRMRRLVDDLLDLSLIESGSWSPMPEPVSLGDAAREVWSELAPELESRRLDLVVDEPDGMAVQADPNSVHQILRNLLSNAIRYGPPGSEITVRVSPSGALVRCEVSDTGPGIPSTHLQRVFERFYRVDPGRSREAGGTGLGLSIVKHLVVAHGGEVGVESEVSRGTTAWFTLPISSEALKTGAVT